MWTTSYTRTTDAEPESVWALLADIGSWGDWNDGIETIEVDGPVTVGTVFRMTPPGADTLTSTITELDAGERLTDVTVVDRITVRVAHLLARTTDGGTTITYDVEVSGAAPEDVLAGIGGAVSADFPEVIAALGARASAGPGTSRRPDSMDRTGRTVDRDASAPTMPSA